MKGRAIILDHIGEHEAAAYLVDGKLDDLLIDETDAPRPGAIFRGICDRPIKGQGGMMLRLPDGEMAFLRAGKGLRPGQPLLVQVTGYSEAGKAIPVTDRVLFKSRYAIVTLGKPGLNISRQITDDDKRDALLGIAHEVFDSEHGLILRSSCEDANEEDIADDIVAMLSLADAVLADADGKTPEALTEGDGPHTLAWREWTGAASIVTAPGSFETHGVLDQLAMLEGAHVPLGEGSMYVEPTRALVAVDVNTGNDTSPAAALKTNLAAARALPRALRLRGLAGQVTVDFVSMSKAHRKQLEQSLRAAFKNDPIETSLVGWTPMGLFELQRKRERPPFPKQLFANL
ncbi:ribonuclease E/G [Loktanella sp. S4079]|uniref:ribonuclease E/G n=1 Tax=Loktanella sp. S4079 TaxID=579483 RepID=UPI0005F9FA7F|nr:ribonuclease E/G [Loktanella sp. S4079]KJZ20595.1 ribonuclease G [Loktanella sp. S4079]